MRRIVALEFVSLDGVMQAPGRADEDPSAGFTLGGWMTPYADPILSDIMKQQMKPPFDLLLGRTTFEIWARYWPLHADAWPGAQTATKYVASNTPSSHDWQPSVFINGDIVEKISDIKHRDGPDLRVFGSANLLQTLMKNDLVDALWLKIYPITLGSGKRLFSEGAVPAAFTLAESAVTTRGVIAARYERARDIAVGSR